MLLNDLRVRAQVIHYERLQRQLQFANESCTKRWQKACIKKIKAGTECAVPSLSFRLTNLSQSLTTALSCLNARKVRFLSRDFEISCLELRVAQMLLLCELWVVCSTYAHHKGILLSSTGITVQEHAFNFPACSFYNL